MIGSGTRFLRSAGQHVVLALLMLAPSTVCAENYKPSAADRLQAIKQALVDLALQTDIKLGSAAYLDDRGVLHESSIMSSDSKVRGVRVLAYLEEAGITVAKVDASILSDPACPGSRPDIRREASVRVIGAPANKRVGDHYISELASISQQALLENLRGSDNWSVNVDSAYASSYERSVSGKANDQVPYRFDISLRKRATPSQEANRFTRPQLHMAYNKAARRVRHVPLLGVYEPWPEAALEYQLTLIDRARGVPLWSSSLPVNYPAVERGYSKDAVPLEFTDRLTQITEKFLMEVNATMDCQTQYYAMKHTPGDSKSVSINAGYMAGIKRGDQFLISTDANILNQALSMSGLAGLSLAEVDSVTKHSATIRHIAGPQYADAVAQSVALHF